MFLRTTKVSSPRHRVRVKDRQLRQWYRTLDELWARKAQIEQELFLRLRNLLSLNVDLVFYSLRSGSGTCLPPLSPAASFACAQNSGIDPVSVPNCSSGIRGGERARGRQRRRSFPTLSIALGSPSAAALPAPPALAASLFSVRRAGIPGAPHCGPQAPAPHFAGSHLLGPGDSPGMDIVGMENRG